MSCRRSHPECCYNKAPTESEPYSPKMTQLHHTRRPEPPASPERLDPQLNFGDGVEEAAGRGVQDPVDHLSATHPSEYSIKTRFHAYPTRSEINDANNILNPIYTRGFRIVVLYVMVPQPYGFRFAFKMLCKGGEGLPVVGEGGGGGRFDYS
jgi:hypothetical protein